VFQSTKLSKKTIKVHQPCSDCGSSDALAVYEDGTYCFSCNRSHKISSDEGSIYNIYNNIYNTPKSSLKNLLEDSLTTTTNRSTTNNNIYNISTTNSRLTNSSLISSSKFIDNNINNSSRYMISKFTKEYISFRNISKETLKFYDVKTSIDDNGVPLFVSFPYGDGAFKHRKLDKKEFYSEGPMNEKSLFGADLFGAGTAKAITITEGEIDALSAFQMLGSKYPTVSVRSATTARKDCERKQKYLNSFDKIYLCFDNDEHGQKAMSEVSQLFDINKVYHVVLDRFKDANDYLVNNATAEFNKIWWNSKPYRPKGIVASYNEIEDILRSDPNVSVAEYPFPSLQNMTYGIRSGELVLFTAQEKVGKTEVIRAIEYHLLSTTDYNIGVIHLEEEEKRSVQGLCGYELKAPCHLPDSGVSIEDQIAAYKRLTKTDGRLNLYQHFGSDDPDVILDVIRYLVAVCHCKFIFLDHITMLVTGFESDDERKKLDYISTRLAMMTRELDFTLFLVSHVNDDGKTRGSRNIAKVADLIIHLDRNIEGATFDERNKTALTVRGNRYAGVTGPAGYLWFDQKTFTLKEMTLADLEVQELAP
jgi:twinkle protein